MANLSITWLGHGGVLYRSPRGTHLWVDRWTGGPTYPDAFATRNAWTWSRPPTGISTTSVRAARKSSTW